MMKLADEDSTIFDMTIDGYQFPENRANYWDTNWLIVRGEVKHKRGNWCFRDPCLTTFELEQLATWFDGVADGIVHPTKGYFTEPNLQFEYVTVPFPAIEVTFSHESAPPWLLDDEQRLDGEIVRFPLASNDLGAVACGLREALSLFPVRSVPERDA